MSVCKICERKDRRIAWMSAMIDDALKRVWSLESEGVRLRKLIKRSIDVVDRLMGDSDLIAGDESLEAVLMRDLCAALRKQEE